MKKLYIILGLILSCLGTSAQTLHLYGGKNHDVYLGCLTCSNYDASSIWNSYGTYGSKYNSDSIWNNYGTYGNKYNSECPWNTYATNPPVVVDKEGNFYGYFTLNKYQDKRADFELAIIIYAYYDMIPDDVGKWYDKIFNN